MDSGSSDVLIIGGGPCGLAVAARLREHTPSALFTDEEHRRYCWINRRRASQVVRKTGKLVLSSASSSMSTSPSMSSFAPSSNLESGAKTNDEGYTGTNGHLKIVVMDGEGSDWLVRWRRLFQAYGIQWLRSPLFFHIDQAERDALLEFAYSQERQHTDTREIQGVVGREISKHAKKKRRGMSGTQGRTQIDERDRRDYFVPSSKMFLDHCASVVNRYGLKDLVKKETVLDVVYDHAEEMFVVKTSKGTHRARAVVVATGPPGLPISPVNLPTPDITGAASIPEDTKDERPWTHSYHVARFPAAAVRARLNRKLPTAVVVVGGGLTAAQLADLALSKGVQHVHLVIRGAQMKVKPFDVDLEWIGKFRNTEKATFWSADDDKERLDMIRTARGGGSVTPPYAKLLKAWQAKGRLSVHLCSTVSSISSLQRSIHDADDDGVGTSDNKESERVRRDSGYGEDADPMRYKVELKTAASDIALTADHVYFATGAAGVPAHVSQASPQPTAIRVPSYLESLQRQHPIEWLQNGPAKIPVVTEDLAWSDDVPLYFTGALAALRLGPGAGNLEGARMGAERCVWAIEERFEGGVTDERDAAEDRYLTGVGGRYESLDGLLDE